MITTPIIIQSPTAGVDVAPPLASVTILTNETGNLTKTFRIEDGTLKKQAAAQLVRGTFEVQTVHDLHELDKLLSGLNPNQAVTYGRPADDTGKVVAQGVENPPPDAITRTRDNFKFANGPGILMLDYDPPKDEVAATADALVEMLHAACPALQGVGMLWRPSASSGVAGNAVRGQRIYIVINDASQIPRVGQVIFERLWLAGSGYYAISIAGQLLKRAPVDAAVWRPEGLDFAAAPVLIGVTRTVYDSVVHEGHVLDAKLLPDLTPTEHATLKAIQAEKRDAIRPQMQAVKQTYIKEHAIVIASSLQKVGIECDDVTIGVMLERATQQQVLMGDWPLITEKGTTVTVGQILDNPDKWHNTRFADPLEPGWDKRVAVAYLRSGGRPVIFSHMHHGAKYYLERAPALIRVLAGQLPEQVDALAEIMLKYGEVYQRAGVPVYVNDDLRIVQAKAPWLTVYVQRFCRFERPGPKEGEWRPMGCPPDVIGGLLHDAARHRMPKLTAVRDAPTMDADGREIAEVGYDSKTGLLLVSKTFDSWPAIPHAPSRKELETALTELWKPFAEFPYASAVDKSVALAAILTTAVRPCLRTSPGFGFSATAPGTGKTLVAQCIGALHDGKPPAVSTPITNEEEWAKSLFSSVLGGTSTLLFDNAEHPIESASLCALTTSPSIKDRVLGESREAEAEHRLLLLATGNGLQFVGDLNRRFLTCRLDARIEATAVTARQFDLEPLGYCVANRVKLIAAALTLIRGYANAGFPSVCDGVASMEDWNKLVRSTIIWLIQQGIAPGFVDPKTALLRDTATDSACETLTGVMKGASIEFGTSAFTAAELIRRAQNVEGLKDLLDDIGGRDGITPIRLGKYFGKYTGRIIGGRHIKQVGKTRSDVVTWTVANA